MESVEQPRINSSKECYETWLIKLRKTKKKLNKESFGYIKYAVIGVAGNLIGNGVPYYSIEIYDQVIHKHHTEDLIGIALTILACILVEIYCKIAFMKQGRMIAASLDNKFARIALKSQYRLANSEGRTPRINAVEDLVSVCDIWTSRRTYYILSIPVVFMNIVGVCLVTVFASLPIMIYITGSYAIEYYRVRLHKRDLYWNKSAKFAESEREKVELAAATIISANIHARWLKSRAKHLTGTERAWRLHEVLQQISIAFRQMCQASTLIFLATLAINHYINTLQMMIVTFFLVRTYLNLDICREVWKSITTARAAYARLMTYHREYSDPRAIIFSDEVCIALENIVIRQRGRAIDYSSCTSFLECGDIVWIAGPPGAGKTSLLRTVCGLVRPEVGRVKMGLPRVDEATVQRAIAYVTQENIIFWGTIRDNITGFDAGIENTEIKRMMKKLNAHEEIQALPNAYDTNVGSDATPISSSLRAKIALGRALLGKSKILLLDGFFEKIEENDRAIVERLINDYSQEGAIVLICGTLRPNIDITKNLEIA